MLNLYTFIRGFIGKALIRLLLILNAIVVIYPVLWSVLASFKTNTEFLTDPWALPAGIAFDNYIRAFTKANMSGYLINSVMVVLFSMLFMLVMVVPSAYSLSRFNFRSSAWIKNTYIACLFIQANLIVIPLFMMLNRLKLTDSRIALSFVLAVLSVPFNVFLLMSFMKTISKEYEYAAMIDGCSYFSTMMKIIVPMSKPAIITVCMLSFFSFFNEYILTLTLVLSEGKYTLPVGMANLYEIQRYATDWGALFAGLVIILMPTILVYSFGQKTLTSGLSVGGLKG